MLRVPLCILCLLASCRMSFAQHHGFHHGGHRQSGQGSGHYANSPYAPVYFTPVVAGGAYPLVAISGYGGHHHHQPNAPIFVSSGPVFFPSTPMVAPSVSVIPVIHHPKPPVVDDPAKHPAKPSTAAGRLRSLKHQASGDEQLRKHLWAQAYMRYRSAIDSASDQGEPRFRQGFTYTAMQHYSSAVREFKRGLFLDPDLPVAGIKLAALFGPGSEIARTSILHKVAEWVREDPRDADRLFLLGLMLHFEDDPRCRDVLKAAQRMAGGRDDHIVALLAAAPVEQPAPEGVGKPPLLPELPSLPGVGVPAMAANVGAGAIIGPQPVPPPGLPPLSDQATPPISVGESKRL